MSDNSLQNPDLEQVKAELAAARRELQIEAALERVRSKAMGMRTSKELLDVVATIHQQFSGLGHECGVFWHAKYTPEFYEKALTSADGSKVSTLIILPRDFSAVPELATWERGTEPLGVFKFDAEAGGQYMDHMVSKGRLLEADPNGVTPDMVRDHGGLTFVQARTSSGEIGYSLWGETEPPEEAKAVLLRLARVFDLAYRRYEDLKEAEKAARNAQINLAVEKVRARAMAMQKPEDLGEVSVLMFDELAGLGVDSLRSGITLPLDDARYEFRAATKSEDGSTKLVVGNESVDVHPIIRRAFDGYVAQEEHQVSVLEGDDLLEYYHAVFDTMPLPDWQERMKTGAAAKEVFATFPFADGWLYTFSKEDYSTEQINLFVRFTKVFGLAYQRYHELTKAEHDYKALLAEKARTENALSTLQATQKQLIEQEKLASLGSLTAGIAHEIKNPLNFVNNFAEVSVEMAEELLDAIKASRMEEAVALISELMDNSAQIAKHGKRADSIVKSMMQHARGGASDRETILVNQFLEEYSNLAWHGMRARDHGFQAEVRRDFDPNAGSLSVMPQELGRVILNLLNNAFDAIKTRKDGVVTVRTVKQDNGLQISVSDNGPGIPDAIRDKIFEPFFTTKATGEGTGLGLSLSYDIVTKGHGGTMTVGESRQGGAEFTVILPQE